MRTAQKLIKFLALALAAFIILVMFAAIIGGVSFMTSLAGEEAWRWDGEEGNWTSQDFTERDIRELDINVKTTNVKFRVAEGGEAVRIETNNEYVSTWMGDNTLNVIEKSHGIFGWGGTGEVVVYVRKGVKFRKVKLEMGAGALEIGELQAEELNLDLGAGRAELNNIKVTRTAMIEGGAGFLSLKDSELRNARLELGVGKVELTTKLLGHSKIDSGVGKLDLNLIGQEKDYRLKIDKGIGGVEVNGQKMSDGAVWGNGNNEIEIESGVGAVEVRMVEE